MECPFKDLEIPDDLEVIECGGAVQIEQIEAIVSLVRDELETDARLYAASEVALKLTGDLSAFLKHVENCYDALKEDVNKRRALAETCRPTKAPSEDRKSVRSQKKNTTTGKESQQAKTLDEEPDGGCMMSDICMSGPVDEIKKADAMQLIKADIENYVETINNVASNLSAFIMCLKYVEVDGSRGIVPDIDFFDIGRAMHEQTEAILETADHLSHLIKDHQR